MAEEPSLYAAEGTEAHSVAEQKLALWNTGHYRKKVACPNKEMDEVTDFYKNYVVETFNEERKKDDATSLFIEVQVNLEKWIPEGFGTSDAVIVSDKTLHVIDFKYGEGVPVSAIENSQLKLYAAGAMTLYDPIYDFKTVKMHIVQPRIGNVSTFEMTVEELTEWLDNSVKPASKQAYEGQGEQRAGPWCRFCKVKARCKARAEQVQAVAAEKNRLDKMLLTDDEIADLLPQLDGIQKWAKDLQSYALEAAMAGTKFKGYKVVEGISRRKIVDETLAAQRLYGLGYQFQDIYQTKLKSITELEKLAGKKAFAEAVGTAVDKPPGAPTLVPETDPRPDILQKSLACFEDIE